MEREQARILGCMALGKRLITIACRGKEKNTTMHNNLDTVCTFGITNWRIYFGNVLSRYPTCRIKPKENKTPFKRPEQQHLAMDIAEYTFL